MKRLFNSKEAAALLGLSQRTLERYRCVGNGPKFLKLQRSVRYREDDLTEWLGLRLRQSTSDSGSRQPAEYEIHPAVLPAAPVGSPVNDGIRKST